MKTLDDLERIRRAGPDLLEALEAIVEGFRGANPAPGKTAPAGDVMSAHTPGALTPHGEKVQRVINLLLASSCFGRDVCGALPCACAETLVQHFEINADLLAALEAILTADNAPLVLSDSHSVALLDAARAAIAKATTAMTKYEAREIARAAIEKVKSW